MQKDVTFEILIHDDASTDRVLTLPLYADLAISDVDKICDVILK